MLAAVFHQVLNLVVLLSRQNDVTANQNLKDDHADAVLVLHDVGVVLESVHLEGGELVWRVQHVNLRLLETLLDGKEDVPEDNFLAVVRDEDRGWLNVSEDDSLVLQVE